MKQMIISIAWKNIWRNKVRSLIVIFAVTLGLWGGIMAIGIMTGWMSQRLDSAVQNEISHVQIHNPDFLNNEEVGLTIRNVDKITQTLDTMKLVKGYSIRSKMNVMVQSDWASTGLTIKAVYPEMERKISGLPNQIIEGEYLDEEYKVPSIILGRKAAETLKLLNYEVTQAKIDSIDNEMLDSAQIASLLPLVGKRFRKEQDIKDALHEALGKHIAERKTERLIDDFAFFRLRSKLAITIQNGGGKIVRPVFRVRGIYKTSNSAFDGSTAFVNIESLNRETGFETGNIHEIAILTEESEMAIPLTASLKKYFPETSVMTWKDLAPDLAYMSDMMRFLDFIYIGIIMLALAFGIINTMLMAVLERFKELGMLMAIGMNKTRVFLMIMFESILLTLTGALTGFLASGITLLALADKGLDFSMWSEGFEAVGWSAHVIPEVTVSNFINIITLVIITGIVAALWPAYKALSLNPANALRTE